MTLTDLPVLRFRLWIAAAILWAGIIALLLGGCSQLSQVASDEALLPPGDVAIADAMLGIQQAAEIGQAVCSTGLLPPADCIRAQADLVGALQQVEAYSTLLGNGVATSADASKFTAAQATIQAVLAIVKKAAAQGKPV